MIGHKNTRACRRSTTHHNKTKVVHTKRVLFRKMNNDDYADIANEGYIADTALIPLDESIGRVFTLWKPSANDRVHRRDVLLHYYHRNRLGEIRYVSDDTTWSDLDYKKWMADEFDGRLRALFPWRTYEEFVHLPLVHGRRMTWKTLWTMTYDDVWPATIPARYRPTAVEFTVRHIEFLKTCVRAVWLVDDGKFYLAHVFGEQDDYVDEETGEFQDVGFGRLSSAFICFPASIVRDRLTADLLQSKLTDPKRAEYPWTDGDEAVRLIRRYRSKKELSYQELSQELAKERQRQ